MIPVKAKVADALNQLRVYLELVPLSAVCDRVVYLDAVLHKLDANKGLFFLSFLILLLIIKLRT